MELKTNFFTPHSTAASANLSAVDDVVVEILFGVLHGFADERAGGEVHDGVGLCRFDGVEDVAFLLRLAENEFCARIHRRTMAFGEVVIDRDGMSGVQQFFGADGADVTRAAGDKNIQWKSARWKAEVVSTRLSRLQKE